MAFPTAKAMLGVFCMRLCLFGQGLGQGLEVQAQPVVRKWGWGAPLRSPKTDRMALGPETMGPGRSQVLGPGQEKDDLRINTDPPVYLNLGYSKVG